MIKIDQISYKPLVPESWSHFEVLFGAKGACAGCWCMYWRLKRSQFEQLKYEGNRVAMKELVDSGTVPGIVGFWNGEPIAWCSVAPREDFPALERSRVMKRVDEKPAWSVSCLFIAREYRNQGVSVRMLEFAKEYCRQKEGKILEGYPVEPKKDKMPPAFAWTGLAAGFRKAGFKEVARRSETRPIMRYYF